MIIACILLLFSILLFAHPAGLPNEYRIFTENNGISLTGHQVADGTDTLIDNGNGTVSILLYPISNITGKKVLYQIDNVSVIRGYNYTTDGKKVINAIELMSTEPSVAGIITPQQNGNGVINIAARIGSDYYEVNGYVRHPLEIKPALESNESSVYSLSTHIGESGNGSAGIVSKLVPFKAGNETVYAQGYEQHVAGPAMTWVRTYGNGSIGTIIKTDDGGYLLAGEKEIQVTGSAGAAQKEYRAWLGKVDAVGKLQWERFYNGSSIRALLEHDGNYVATGDIGGNLWLLETDMSGHILIDHTYNNSSNALAGTSIAPIGDEGCMITGNLNYPNAFVARADDNLSIIWDKDLSRYGIIFGNDIICTKDGNFVVCGGEEGNIAKIDAAGNVLWNTTLGEDVGLVPVSLCPASDGGFMAAYLEVKSSWWPQGITVSKLSSDGTIMWSKTFYGAGSADVSAMTPSGDGGYLISGYSSGFASGVYVLKIDDAGNALWSALYDRGAAGPIVLSDDGGYIMAASSGPMHIASISQIELVRLSGIIRK